MGEISGRNSFIWFFWHPTAIGWKSSKTDITYERSNCNSNPFRFFIRALCSIYRRSFIEIRGRHLGRFPRKSLLWFFWNTMSSMREKIHCLVLSLKTHTKMEVTRSSFEWMSDYYFFHRYFECLSLLFDRIISIKSRIYLLIRKKKPTILIMNLII